MTLVPYSGFRCIACGAYTDRGFPKLSCCESALPVQILVEEPVFTDEDREALDEVRRGDAELVGDAS
jgi:hypothetical protein